MVKRERERERGEREKSRVELLKVYMFDCSPSGGQVFGEPEASPEMPEHSQRFHGGCGAKQNGGHCQLTQLYRKRILRTRQLRQGSGTTPNRLQPGRGTVR